MASASSARFQDRLQWTSLWARDRRRARPQPGAAAAMVRSHPPRRASAGRLCRISVKSAPRCGCGGVPTGPGPPPARVPRALRRGIPNTLSAQRCTAERQLELTHCRSSAPSPPYNPLQPRPEHEPAAAPILGSHDRPRAVVGRHRAVARGHELLLREPPTRWTWCALRDRRRSLDLSRYARTWVPGLADARAGRLRCLTVGGEPRPWLRDRARPLPLRAFEVHALDYLLKPFDVERFTNALARADGRCSARARRAGRLAGCWSSAPAAGYARPPAPPLDDRLW